MADSADPGERIPLRGKDGAGSASPKRIPALCDLAVEEPGKLRLLVRDPAGDPQTQEADPGSGEIIQHDAFVAPQPISLSVSAEMKGEKGNTSLKLIPLPVENGHAYSIELPGTMPKGSSIEVTVDDGFRAEKQLIRNGSGNFR